MKLLRSISFFFQQNLIQSNILHKRWRQPKGKQSYLHGQESQNRQSSEMTQNRKKTHNRQSRNKIRKPSVKTEMHLF